MRMTVGLAVLVLCIAVSSSTLAQFQPSAKTYSSCFNEWRIPNCSDQDPKVGRTCTAMRQGHLACIGEVLAENIKRKREREAEAHAKEVKDQAEADARKRKRKAKAQEQRRAEMEAVEKANRAAQELGKLNGPKGKSSSPIAPGRIDQTKPREKSEEKGF